MVSKHHRHRLISLVFNKEKNYDHSNKNYVIVVTLFQLTIHAMPILPYPVIFTIQLN